MNTPEISPKDVNSKSYKLIDVRTAEEFNGELGHAPGSQLITIDDEFEKALESFDKDEKIIFICRSGNRSGTATTIASNLGFKNVFNMTGGMLLWNELGLETEK